MADRYWVGGSGNWSDNLLHWAATSGGASGASLPGSGDNVFFDNLSHTTNYTVTMNAGTKQCLNFTATAPAAGNMTMAFGSVNLSVFGNFSSYAGMLTTGGTPSILFASTSTGRTITTNGVNFSVNIEFTGSGGGWTLQDNFTTLGEWRHTRGTVDQNGFTVRCNAFHNSNANVRTYTMTGAAIVVERDVNGVMWTSTTLTNLTLNNSGSTVEIKTNYFTSQTISFPVTVTFGSWAFANLTFSNNAGYGNITITTPPTVGGAMVFSGANANNQRLFVRSSVRGTQRTFTCNGTVSVTNCDFEDIASAGSAGTWSGTSVGDCGGNSGITFTTPVDRFWVGNGGDILSTARWSATSGGSSGASFPLPQDTAKFNASSFSSGSQSITWVGTEELRLGNVDFTGVTNSPIFDNDNIVNFYGSVTFVGMTFGGVSDFNFLGRGSHTMGQGGITSTITHNFDSISGTYALSSTFGGGASTPTIFVISGTFDGNDQNVTVAIFNGSNSNTRTIRLGNGTYHIALTGTPWVMTTTTNLTFDAEGSNISFENPGVGTSTFSGGGLTYNTVTLAGTSTGTAVLAGSNTYATLRHSSATSRTLNITAGTTQTFTTFDVIGASGNLITVQSTAASNYNFVKAGGGKVNVNFLNISRCQATPNTVTWYVGSGSTDGGNNTGLIFTAPPSNAGLIVWG